MLGFVTRAPSRGVQLRPWPRRAGVFKMRRGRLSRNLVTFFIPLISTSPHIPWLRPQDVPTGSGKLPVLEPRGTEQPVRALLASPGSELSALPVR